MRGHPLAEPGARCFRSHVHRLRPSAARPKFRQEFRASARGPRKARRGLGRSPIETNRDARARSAAANAAPKTGHRGQTSGGQS
ncbi:Hypothetical protein A7982_05404 [Minicystis rosea]|nr:Hypothetical protein A7982_05404 [Minicystis rosea]